MTLDANNKSISAAIIASKPKSAVAMSPPGTNTLSANNRFSNSPFSVEVEYHVNPVGTKI